MVQTVLKERKNVEKEIGNIGKKSEKIIEVSPQAPKTIGYHIICELKGVDADRISLIEQIAPIVEKAIKESGLTLVKGVANPIYKQFKPYGVTGVALLEESHIAFHTWPEYNYLTLDIFSCGPKEAAEKAYKIIVEALKPKEIKKVIDYKSP